MQLTALSSSPVDMSELIDERSKKRSLSERKNKSLQWRSGRFTAEEISMVKAAVDSWASESGLPPEDAKDQLRWAKDNGVRGWCSIAERSGLMFRKIEAIRACALRHVLHSEKTRTGRWSEEETAEFKNLQQIHGDRSWKAIAKELGRTLEEVQNKGKSLRSGSLGYAALADSTINKVPPRKKTKKTDNFSVEECKLVNTVRNLSDNGILIHDIPWVEVSEQMTGATDRSEYFRVLWRDRLFSRITKQLEAEGLSNRLADQAIVYYILRAIHGKLDNPFPAVDLESVPWNRASPFWPRNMAQSRIKVLLTQIGRTDGDFKEAIEALADHVDMPSSNKECKQIAKRYFQAVQSKLHQIADSATQQPALQSSTSIDI